MIKQLIQSEKEIVENDLKKIEDIVDAKDLNIYFDFMSKQNNYVLLGKYKLTSAFLNEMLSLVNKELENPYFTLEISENTFKIVRLNPNKISGFTYLAGYIHLKSKRIELFSSLVSNYLLSKNMIEYKSSQIQNDYSALKFHQDVLANGKDIFIKNDLYLLEYIEKLKKFGFTLIGNKDYLKKETKLYKAHVKHGLGFLNKTYETKLIRREDTICNDYNYVFYDKYQAELDKKGEYDFVEFYKLETVQLVVENHPFYIKETETIGLVKGDKVYSLNKDGELLMLGYNTSVEEFLIELDVDILSLMTN